MVQSSFLPAADPENYELLSWSERLLLLAAGGLVLATLLLVQDALESLDLSKAGFLKKLSIVNDYLYFHHGVASQNLLSSDAII